jgi:MFS family permease
MQASAGFVSASALGMACGPALAGLLQTKFKIWKLTFNQETLPGWVMAVAWLMYLIWLLISFKEPSREFEENQIPQESNAGMLIYTFWLISCTYLILSALDHL